MQIQKMSFFSQKVAYVRLKLGQNQGLWRHFSDTMSPWSWRCFSVPEEGDSGHCSRLEAAVVSSSEVVPCMNFSMILMVYSGHPSSDERYLTGIILEVSL